MYPQAGKLLVSLLLPLIFVSFSAAMFPDDDIPEVTDRVARVSFVEGDVRLRRADSEEWEQVVMNLPIVEGDEIMSEADARFEIQFSSAKHLRASENTYIRIVTLNDDGLAVSVPQGSVNVFLSEFDKDAAFFEIDAPQTTVALQSAGSYRVDAGQPGDDTVRIRVEGEGEARVYSQSSGFTLNSGRSATVMTAGQFAGEWRLEDSGLFTDAFDRWSADREKVIAERLARAHYNEYYDTDIYGAEELTDHGDWIHTRDYGYVWRPWRSSISGWADWSPYRYGTWRWIHPFGWTWVNDEPWGWATYHYGRWVWYNGFWHWAPYSSYHVGRSWWRPALVVFTTWGNNYCWYPLPYHYAYYNYNYHYYSKYPRRPRGERPRGGSPGPSPSPTPGQTPTTPGGPILTPEQRLARRTTPPLQYIPPTGVVTVAKSDFDRGAATYKRAALENAREVLSKVPGDGQSPPILPIGRDLDQKPGTVRPTPATTAKVEQVRTGAGVRNTAKPMDDTLRQTRILGNRPPLEVRRPATAPTERSTVTPVMPRTGAVERPVIRTAPVQRKAEPSSPVYSPPIVTRPATPPATTKAPEQKPAAPSSPVRTTPTQRRPAASPSPTPSRVTPPATRSAPSQPPMQRSAPQPATRAAPAPQRTVTRPAPESKPAEKPAPAPARSETTKKDG
jgi:hypothetical protein